jgi:pimeloyl-ACP methyl ester carboxylesterase
MNLREWREGGKFFDHAGLPIFYRQRGGAADEVTLCLHGFPSASFDFHKIWDGLTENFPTLAPDLIGYGFSAKPRKFDYTTFAQAEMVESLLEHLNVRRVHILTHDYGNTVTQELLARRVEKRLKFSIESVCFLNGGLFPETHRPVLAQKILLSPAGFLFGKLIPDARFKQSLAAVFGAETKPTKAELNDFLALFARGGERWVSALLAMDFPVRLINGSADPVSGAHLVERFREICLQFTDIVELEKIGHFPQFEAPEAVLKKYSEFR